MRRLWPLWPGRVPVPEPQADEDKNTAFPSEVVPLPPVVSGVETLPFPNEPEFLDLLRLWEAKRRGRALPSRMDFDPAEFKTLLPDVFLIDVLPPPVCYRFRLMGERVVSFHGGNFTGKTFEDCFEPAVAVSLVALFDAVVKGRRPIFRTGVSYWWDSKKYWRYESCYFPLSADESAVNMVLGAIKFAMYSAH